MAYVQRVKRPFWHRGDVVEDDTATRDMLRRLLERENWVVDEAANGRLALEGGHPYSAQRAPRRPSENGAGGAGSSSGPAPEASVRARRGP